MTEKVFLAEIEKYQNFVYTICYQMVRDSFLAQDLAQETFLSAYTHLDSFSGDNVKPWLARIATNKAKDHLKSAYARRVEANDEKLSYQLAPPGEQPAPQAEQSIGLERIHAAVTSLKEPYLQVAMYYFYKQLSVQEIAQELGRPPKTVETQLYRARQKLQEMLKEEST